MTDETKQQRILLVSNRLPMTASFANGTHTLKRSAGGLVNALAPLHKVANTLWVGYAGDLSKDTQGVHAALVKERFIPVTLAKRLYSDYYNGLSNGGIWPLFHYFPSLGEYRESDWLAYKTVNQLFCETILKYAQDGDLIWVHDYQLMLLPQLLRSANPTLKIGYFHHVPFPATEVYRVLPWRVDVLEGLLGADVVGFHTVEYARHFVNATARHLGVENHADEVHVDGRVVKVGAFPLGVDTAALQAVTRNEAHIKKLTDFHRVWDGKTLIIGIDRLDYTKGIKERLEAFALFLKQNPSFASKVVLLQVSVPSRVDVTKYGDLRSEVERLVSKINGEFGSTTHTPVQYLFKSLDMPELTALYRRADICLITPLRDGLNLVCKEYVTLKEDLNGVLVLSEFVGAAEEMGEALLINPYDTQATANAIATALEMPLEERKNRMRALRNRVFSFNNESWSHSFIESVEEAVEVNLRNASREFDAEERHNIEAQATSARMLLFCVDYDALFLPEIRRYNHWAHHTAVLDVLRSFTLLNRIEVFILTSQTREFCDNNFKEMSAWLVAENGAFVKHASESEWLSRVNRESYEAIRPEVLRIFERCVRRVPGSRLEERENSLQWNYLRTRSTFAHGLALEVAHNLNDMLSRSLYHCIIGRTGLEVRPTGVTKGTSVEAMARMFQFDPARDLLITIGDNKTDEDLFRIFSEQNISISVGPTSAFSRLTVGDPQLLLTLLRDMSAELAVNLKRSDSETGNQYVSTWHHRKLSDLGPGKQERDD